MSRYIVRDAPAEHWGWLTNKLGLYVTSAFRAIEAVDSAGKVHGMVGYDCWTPNAVQLHIAVAHPSALLALVGPGLRFPFEQAFGRGVGLVSAAVNDDNDRCKRMLKKLGFRLAYRQRGGYTRSIDVLLFEMTRKEWHDIRGFKRAKLTKLDARRHK